MEKYIVEKEAYLGPVCERFGISPEFFDAFILLKLASKTLNIANADIQAAEKPVPASIGMPFLHIKMASPKLTSAAAMWLGPQCTQGVVELDTDHANAFLRREMNFVEPEIAESVGRGYVMVKHDGIILGLGFLGGPGDPTALESFVPRAWALGEQAKML